MQERPEGWVKYREKYSTSEMILTDLLNADDESNVISSVLLKNLNCEIDRNYFIRPGQHLGVGKFRSMFHYSVYCWIKTIKKILIVDLSLYMLKKTLLRPTELSFGNSEEFLFVIMAQAQVKEKFETKIDYDRWSIQKGRNTIPLK
jgi:hypothetical protein